MSHRAFIIGGTGRSALRRLDEVRAADWKTAFPMFGHNPSDPFDYAAEDAALAG